MARVPGIPRLLNLERLLETKSHFLLVSRQAGESFLIAQLPECWRLGPPGLSIWSLATPTAIGRRSDHPIHELAKNPWDGL